MIFTKLVICSQLSKEHKYDNNKRTSFDALYFKALYPTK